MERKREMFMEDWERKAKKIAEYVLQYPNYAEEIINFVLVWCSFETKKTELEEKHKHEMKELYKKFWVDYNL